MYVLACYVTYMYMYDDGAADDDDDDGDEDSDGDDDDQGRLHGGSAQGGDCSRGLSRHWDWKSQIRKHIRRSSPLT